jgi:hypothetical protein
MFLFHENGNAIAILSALGSIYSSLIYRFTQYSKSLKKINCSDIFCFLTIFFGLYLNNLQTV